MRNLMSATIIPSVIAATLPLAAAQITPGSQDPPRATFPPLGSCTLAGPIVRVSSKLAGNEGLVVRLTPPAKARYPEGAPVAVHSASGVSPSVSRSLACLSKEGFVDVTFLCPGNQERQSDGIVLKSGASDFAGPRQLACVEALADVIGFATGKLRSTDGKPIQDYMPGIELQTDNAGLVGWSNGGVVALYAMAQYGQRFPGLKWYASWESPVLGTGDHGRVSRFEPNPFYDPKTDTVDFGRLRYSVEMPIWSWPLTFQTAKPDWPRGGLYLDGDGNGRFNREADYAFWGLVETGPPFKVFYPRMVTEEARKRKVFGDTWPAHIATVEEAERHDAQSDVTRLIPSAVKNLPSIAVLVFESEQHHVGASMHLHAVAQVNGWLDARARWVRFNPDAHYVRRMMGKAPSREVQYPAMKKIDRAGIIDLLEPEAESGGPTDAQGMAAAICELADRTHYGIWAATLTRVLIP